MPPRANKPGDPASHLAGIAVVAAIAAAAPASAWRTLRCPNARETAVVRNIALCGDDWRRFALAVAGVVAAFILPFLVQVRVRSLRSNTWRLRSTMRSRAPTS